MSPSNHELSDSSAPKRIEEGYRQLVENLSDGFFFTDTKGKIISCNVKGAEMFGYTHNEVIGKHFIDLVYPDHRDVVMQAWKFGLDSGELSIAGFEVKGIKKDGNPIYLHLSNSIFFEDNIPQGYLSLIRDISEMKRIEQALRESEIKYRALVEKSIQGIAIFQEFPPKLVFINPAASEILGYSIQELLNMSPENIQKIIYPNDLPLLLERFQDLIKEEREPSQELEEISATRHGPREIRVYRKDGVFRWLELFGVRIDFEGKPAVQISIVDVTDRISAEEAYRALVDQSPLGLIILQNGLIVFANNAFADMSGYTIKELLDFDVTKVRELIHPDDRSLPWDLLRDMIEGKKVPSKIEVQGIRKDGTVRWIEISFVIIEYGGLPASQATVIDIHDRKMAETIVRRERDRAQRYLDIAGVIFIAVDVNGKITLINKRGCEVLGYREEEIIGKNYFDTFIPDELRPGMKEFFRAGIEGEIDTLDFVENPVLTKNGSRRLISWHTTLLYDEHGNVTGALTSGEDITERKVAEEALRLERDRAKQYLHLAGVAFLGIDRNQNIFLVNRRGYEIFGYDEDELLGKNYFDTCIPERIRNTMRDLFDQAMEGKYELKEFVENPIIIKDGSERMISWHTTVLHSESGDIIGILTSGEDITERTVAETALHASEERFRSLVEDTADWVWEVDSEGRFGYSNSSVEDILGFTAGQIIGRTLWEYIVPEEKEKSKSFFEESAEKKRAFRNLANHYNHRDGTTVVLEASGRPIFNTEGQVVGFRGVCRDITQRMIADKILKESEARYRALVETSPDGIILTDIEGKIILANKRALQMFGVESEDDMLGKIAYDFVHPEDQQRAHEGLKEVLQTGSTGSHEFAVVKKDGTKFPIEVSASVLYDVESQPTGIVTVSRDISTRKEEEEELAEAKARAEFFTDLMAHDLNNINQAILSALELLMLEPQVSDAIKESIELALEQVERSSDLISRVKKFSRMDSVKPTLEVHDIEASFQTAFDTVKQAFPEKTIRVDTNIHPGKFKALADDFVIDLFFNVLHNAAKFDREKKVELEVKVRYSDDKRFLRVEIKDHGPGIPDDVKEKIFARYVTRVEEPTMGSGIGLTLVKRIVDRYGGDIWVEDRVKGDYKKGANFVILLPAWK